MGEEAMRDQMFSDAEQTTASLKSVIEALLFVASDPLSVERISELTQANREEVEKVLVEMRREAEERNSGIMLKAIAGGYRFHTNPCAHNVIDEYLKADRKTRLTRAAVETLAIIAYMQPITRAQIASTRGIQSETMVKTLEEMELVKKVGTEKSPGGPVLYGTTSKFLQKFGMFSLDDLPPLEGIEEEIAKGKATEKAEIENDMRIDDEIGSEFDEE